MKRKILITDDVHSIMLSNFEQAGYHCDYYPEYTNKQVFDCIDEYFGIVINSKTKIFKPVIDKATRLKFIGRLGSGMEIIDVTYANTKGIKCFSVPEANKDAVAEHAIAMLLSLFNNLKQADTEVRNLIWQREKNRGIELGSKTIALIGYGNTGKALAKKLSGFDVEVLAYDKYLENYSDAYAKESTMQEIFEQADVVSFHLPLTKETQLLCNQNYVEKFKKPIYIINTARGKIIALEKIFSLFFSKKILGACLDVFENEKVQQFTQEEKVMYEKIYALNTVILSPHVAGWTKESKFKIAKFLSNKVIDWFNN